MSKKIFRFIAWFCVDLLILIPFWYLINYAGGNNFHFPGWNFWGIGLLLIAYRTSGIFQEKYPY
jgi:hypothetical protein